MKKSKLIYSVILFLIFSLLIIVKFTNITFQIIDQLNRTELNKFSFILILSLIISLLILLIFEKRLDFWSIFNFSWIMLVVFVTNCFLISNYDYKIIDYSLSKKITDFKVETYYDQSWKITRITYEKDTLYNSQNSKTQKIYSGDYNLNKSRFQEYYYLTKKN